MAEKRVLPSNRQKTFRSRSKTGCRTCRVRRVRCDEFPGACNNCTSTGRKCEYDLYRLPAKRNMGLPRIYPSRFHGPALTSDEQTCFAYFQYHTVSGLVDLFDSPLWERYILPQSCAEPAVCHAVIMLSAIHQDAESNCMRLSGNRTDDSHLNFALEHSTRSSALLRRRGASNDPQKYQAVITCCLLFVMGELLRGQYGRAAMHLHHGVQLIKEAQAQGQVIDPDLVGFFDHLNVTAALYAADGPAQSIDSVDEPEWVLNVCAIVVHSVGEAQQAFTETLNYSILLIAYLMRSTQAEILAKYDDLWLKRQRILARYADITQALDSFCQKRGSRFTPKEERGADVLRHLLLVQYVTLRVLFPGDYTTSQITVECAALLSSSLAIMNQISRSTTFTMEPVVCPGLHIVATLCPDLRLRVRAIEALRAWPHMEGMINSQVCASIAVEALKAEVQKMGKDGESWIAAEYPEGRDRFLVEVLQSSQKAADWAPIRMSQLDIGDAVPYPEDTVVLNDIL
ncbi:hypothetical protein BO86DRAFT_314211 [Aspergillus japonicus CBS 114.51]|uniref:Zn(2)-C6 fungal-type domain-containing protein n=1 Tax=Aspergillus japonicus CBS 114.51 TaxID=1448312 RepID=A0A8T8WZP8_ASPJA|nr:hypothetical protein BO86DRAFT_314211 [Aspergillus japonicus CBS 114.51]RAH81366.1 hypothetical protein BO86DRAFT_314211 [Aspergillus japonicus CBS 114.51]